MSEDELKLPSPFKEIVQKIDPLRKGIIKEAYMDEKTYRLGGKIKGLREYLGIDENASICDAYIILSQGQKSVIIEDKNMKGRTALRRAYGQLANTIGLLKKANKNVDCAVISTLKVDTKIHRCEYIKGDIPLKRIKRKDSSKNRVLNIIHNGLEIPLYIYRT